MGGFDDHVAIMGDWMPPSPSPRTFFSSLLGDDVGSRSTFEGARNLASGTQEHVENSDGNDGAQAGAASEQMVKLSAISDQKMSSSRGGLLERLAARAGFNAPKLNTESLRPADLSHNQGVRSPCLTIPPGLSPTSLLESPVFLSKIMSRLKKKLAKSFQNPLQLDEMHNIKLEVKLEPEAEHLDSRKDGQLRNEKHPALSSSKPLKLKNPHVPNSLSSIEKRKKSANSAKNIVKNFARAMVTFTLSDIAHPYLSSMFVQKNIDIKEFKEYFKQRKENMDGISSLRALLLAEDYDEEEVVEYKKIFQFSCEIFLKYFSVNWVYSSKIGDRMAHVKARFKMLRRIQNPEYFTYLKL